MWCIANDMGELIAHDVRDKETAEIICSNIKEKEPSAGWEVTEQ